MVYKKFGNESAYVAPEMFSVDISVENGFAQTDLEFMVLPYTDDGKI